MPLRDVTAAPASPQPADIFLPADAKRRSLPVWLARDGRIPADLTAEQKTWLKAVGFRGHPRKHALLPASDGGLAGAVLGLGTETAVGATEAATSIGVLPTMLPAGHYHLEGAGVVDGELAAVAWGLGAYRFRRYKTAEADPLPALKLAKGIDRARVVNTVEAVWMGRDLVNTPANDMGPVELEAAARMLADRHGANFTSIVGDELLGHNFPLIHAVGRASPRAPRLVDITWGRPGAPTVTLVGKGICFDTGGLDIKPSSGMLLMKKDMGGAAAVLAMGHMIMGQKLDVRLRILLAIAENAIAGNAFRPGDIITSRQGRTVEIGNTDAEGRLVLADALAYADEEAPLQLMAFATLTGAARVALGPDLPPLFTEDDALAAALQTAGNAVGDPVWRLPFATQYYDAWLDNAVADINNVAEGGFGGAIVGALFLKRFVKRARSFAHFDIYGWRSQPKPLGPKGGEVNAARAVVEMLRRQHGKA